MIIGKNEEAYMRRAIELAKRGVGAVNPNPLVGAVIVKDGRVIGEGYHTRYGELHAEREALKSLASVEDARGADMYVTLEPCCHTGKQPPCTEAVVEAGIKRVFVGSSDPNPLVAGKGIEYLRAHGVEVETGVLKDESDAINRVFFHFITKGRPYVVFKYAMSMDGKIATASGESQWISCEESRAGVQEMRRELTGIMVGSGTVLADDPMLNCRLDESYANVRHPVRIVCDSRLRIPEDSKLVKTAGDYRTVVAYSSEKCGDAQKAKRLADAGVELIDLALDPVTGKIDLTKLLDSLGSMKIDGILLEGGGGLADSFARAGLIDEVRVFIAPKLIGGEKAKTPVEGEGVAKLADALKMRIDKAEQIGEDIMLTYLA